MVAVGSGTYSLTVNAAPVPSIHTIASRQRRQDQSSGAVSVTEGGSQTFTITQTRYAIVCWVDGVNVGAVSSHAFYSV